MEYAKPKGNYIALESFPKTGRTIWILHTTRSNFDFKLGRGLDQDLRTNDISVSRYHAKIILRNNKFVLDDNLSKFGTLVMVKKNLQLYPGMNRTF